MSLSSLYDHVKLRLEEWNLGTVVAFGQRELAQQIHQGQGRANRVVIAPADPAGGLGAYGPRSTKEIGAPAGTPFPPRSLWTWKVAARVLVWAYDPIAPNDERMQWDALCELHDAVITAFQSWSSGNYALRVPRDPAPQTERRFGAATLFIADVNQHVLDVRKVVRTGPVVGSDSAELEIPSPPPEEPE